MADGITLNSGSGGDTLAADDVGGTKYPRSKLIHGADGVNDGDVAKTNPLPVGFNTVKDGSGTLYAPLVDADGHQQVDVVAALPAGTNAIGKLAANSGVDIGDVDVLSIAAGDNNIGNVDIVTVPADPFGVNADAASATGSISAKLRFIASTDLMLGTDFSAVLGSASLVTTTQADDIANTIDTLNASAFGYVFDGSTWDRMRGDATNGVLVNLGANNDVTIGAALPAGGNTIGAVTITGDALTSLQLADDVVKIDDAAFTPASDKVAMVGAQFDDAATDTVDEGDAGALRMSTRRELYVQVRDAAGNERGLNVDSNNRALVAATAVGATAHDSALSDAPVCIGGFAKAAAPTSVSADGDAVRAWFALNGAQFVVLVGADGQQSGVLSHGAQKVGGDWEHLDDSAFTPAGARVAMVGFFADETSTDSVNEGDGGAARMTLDRKQIVTDYAHTAGGLTPHKTVSAATTNATNVKGSAGQLYEIVCTNINAAVRYLKLYDKATAPTVGTDTPVWTLAIPGNTAGAGLAKTIPKGLTFANGIGFALTTGVADSDTGAVAANELVVNLGYK